MPAEESKPVDPAVAQADKVIEEAATTAEAKGKQPEVDSEDDDDDAGDEVPAEAPGAAGEGEGASKKNKKKKSKRKKLKEVLTGKSSSSGSSDPQKDIAKALGNLSPQQIQELLTLNPALAQELSGTSSDKDASEALKKLKLEDILTGLAASGKNVKDMASYKFWGTQPVPKFGDFESKVEEGPLRIQKVEDVPKEPPAMIAGFEWVTMDLEDDAQMKEVYQLLNGHYVEDDEAMFRFNYSPSLLKWVLMAPGWKKEWHVGVRASQSRALVAFISAVPVHLQLRKNLLLCSEVNFICVHKKLRGKRLAPVLIKEITRRSNEHEIWQGLYTAGVVLPTPISTCRYFHRAINWQKLYEVGFSPLPANSKPQYQVRKYQLPSATTTPGLREIEEKDIDATMDLYHKYMARFEMYPKYDREEFIHWFIPKKEPEQVVWTYVVEKNGEITDMFSFYNLESSVISSAKHQNVRAAYLFYYATTTGLGDNVDKAALKARLNLLVSDALILAKKYKFDVFNALSLMDNGLFLEQQKFGPGDGQLHYYLFNYRANPIRGGVDQRNKLDEQNLSGIGLVMM